MVAEKKKRLKAFADASASEVINMSENAVSVNLLMDNVCALIDTKLVLKF